MYSLAPTLSITAHDADNYPGTALSYSFNLYANGSTTALASSGALATPSWTVPAGKIAYGKTFYWTAQVTDGQAASLWSAPDYFNVPAAPQPLVTAHLGVSPYDSTVKGVDPQMGDYSTQATDASLPGPADGAQSQIVRTYNSLDPGVFKAFGAGWSSLLDMRATPDSDGTGNVLITLADGRQERFGANGDGTFSPPPGDSAILSNPIPGYGDSGYTLIDKSGMRYVFTRQATDPVTGQSYFGITQFGDRNGHGMGFYWSDIDLTLPDGSTVQAWEPITIGYAVDQDNGFNDGVTNGSPEAGYLELSWGVQEVTVGGVQKNVPHVKTVEAFSPSTPSRIAPWTYTYDGTGHLKAVCPPDSETTSSTACTNYSYTSGAQSGSHFSSMIQDSNPTDYWRLNDAAGATAAADNVVINEGLTNATPTNLTFGQSGALAGTSATSAHFNGTSSYLALPDNLLASSSNLAVGLWFNTTQAGGTLFSQQSGKPGTTITTHYTPSIYIGSDGKVHAEFWDGQVTPMASPNAVNDGKWHFVVLSGARTSQTLFLDGRQVATRSGSTITVLGSQPYTTIGAGQLGGTWPALPTANPLGYFSGQIEDTFFLQHPLGLPAVQQEYTSAVLAATELTGSTLPSGKTAFAVGYDAVADRATSVTDQDGGTYQLAAPVTTGSDVGYYGVVRGTRPSYDYPMTEPSGLTSIDQYGIDQPNDGSTDGIYNDVMLGEPGIFGPGGDTAAGFNGTSSYLSLPSAALDDTTGSASVALWFNTKQAGGVLLSYQNGQIGTVLTGKYTPALYIGADGLLHGQLWDGHVAPMASKATVNDGNWHLVVLTASGTTQTLWLDGQKQATRTGLSIAGQAETLGQTTVTVGAGYIAGSWPKPPSNVQGYFDGEIGQVGIYRTDIDQTGVEAALGLYRAKGSATVRTPTTVESVTDPNQATESFTYDPTNGNRTIAVTDVMGHRTTFGYDSMGFQDVSTDPDGHTTSRQHDKFGNVLQTTTCRQANSCQTSYFSYHTNAADPLDPLNGKVLFAADARSGATGTANPAYRTAYTYTAFGALASVTTPPTADYPAGRTTRYTYYTGKETYTDGGGSKHDETFGMVATVTDPRGLVTRYHYADGYGAGEVSELIGPSGETTYSVYDTLGRLSTQTVGSDSFPVSFDSIGQIHGGVSTTYAYDYLNRIVTKTGPATTDAVTGKSHTPRTEFGYDVDGRPVSEAVSDSTGGDATRTTITAYDDSDRVESVTDPAGLTTSYTYDEFGRKSTESDPDGVTYAYGYSPIGQLTTTTLKHWIGDPTTPSTATDLVTESRSYDPAGRLASVTDSMGRTTKYNYFDDDLLQSETVASGTTSAQTDKAYDYDAAGNVIWECDVWEDGSCARPTQYTVDQAGRTTRTVVDPSGANRTTVNTFDPDNNVLSQLLTGSGGDTRQIGFAYDALGNTTSQSVRTDASGPAGYWPLNEGAVTASDSSGNGFTGTPSAGVSWSAPGGNYAHFDGASGAVLTSGTPVVDTTKDFSVSAWAYLDSTSTTKDFTVVSQQGNQNSAFQIQYNHTTKTWGFVRPSSDTASPSATYNATATAPATAGVWTHLVAEYDAALGWMSFWVNGVQVSGVCQTCSDTLVIDPTPMASTSGVAIGRAKAAGAAVNFFPGRIRDVQLYSRDLSNNEVSELYVSGHTPEQSPVALGAAGWWKLDDGESAGAADLSGAGNPGKLNSATSWSSDNGGAAVFGGGGEIATVGPVADTSKSFSVSAWAKIAATPAGSWQTVVSQQGNTAAGFSLDYNPTAGRWAFDRATTDASAPATVGANSTAAPALNTWTHLVGTYDAPTGKLTLYVNGVAQGTASDTTPIASAGPLAIGRGYANGAAANRFNGSISKVQVYKRVLSAAEVGSLHTNGGTAGSAPLVTTTTYDERGLPTSTTDPRGNAAGATAADHTTRYTYDEAGQLVTTSYPEVAAETNGSDPQQIVPVTMAGYDTFGEQTESDDADGMISTSTFDPDGRLLAASQPAYTPPGASTAITPTTYYTYDGMGRPLTAEDPLGHTAHYVYDQLGNQVQETLPGGYVTHVGYDTDGEVLNTTDPAGAQTQATYNPLGQQITATQVERVPQPAVYTSTYGYDALGNRTTVTDPSQHTTTTGYNTLGEPITVKDPLGNTTKYTYDAAGQVVKSIAADGSATVFAYDLAERLLSTTQLDVNGVATSSTSNGYDADGNVVSATDARQHTSTASFDALNRTVSQTQPATATTSITTGFGYDAAGLETRYKDPNGNSTISTYNSLGLLESTADPSVTGQTAAADRTTTYAYDADGRPTTITRPGGVVLNNTYDVNGLLKTQSGSGAESATVTRSYTYDAAGRPTSVSTPDGSDGFGYDDRGLVVSMTGPSGSASYSYDENGQITSRTDATGTSSFSYDDDQQLNSETDPLTGTTIGIEYNSVHQPKKITYGTGGPTRSYGYDSEHRLKTDVLTNPQNATESSTTYGYNTNGQITSKDVVGGVGAGSSTYDYDFAGRLTSSTSGGASTGYGYDADGNRTSAGTVSATYNARDQLISVTNGSTSSSYSYTPRGSMASTTTDGSTITVSSDAYDEETATSDGSTYTYDGLGRLATVHSGGQNATFTYGDASNNAVSDGTDKFGRDADGGLISMADADGGDARFALRNSHGDITGSFTGTGSTLTGSVAYDPFGRATAASGDRTSLGYQGGWTDPGTGNVNAAARWYNPVNGNFTSADTVSNSPTPAVAANPYAYADDDPLDAGDTSGHDACTSDDLKAQEREWEAQAARAAAAAKASLEAFTKNFFASVAQMKRDNAAAQRRRDAENRAFNERIAQQSAQFEAEFNAAMNAPFATHSTYSPDGLPQTHNSSSYSGYSAFSGGHVPSSTSSASSGGGFNWGLAGAWSAVATTVPIAGKVTFDWLTSSAAEEVYAGLGELFSPFSYATQDCGANGVPTRPGQQNLGGSNPAPVLGTTPNEDTTSAISHAASSAVAATDTSTTTAEDEAEDKQPDYCNTGASRNAKGNITYMPRHRQGAFCVASGAFGDLSQSDYTGAERPRLRFQLPGFGDLPEDNKARGHLIGYAFGGSNKDTRNFVALYQQANQSMFDYAESPVLQAIKNGGHEFVQVTPVYGIPGDPIPTTVVFVAFGTIDETCVVYNKPTGGTVC
ncbi:RHS repeat-associated core domain-containing protein [Actinacidiphila alni]|uniref:RHS repeat-associated core domain-containing protein n=1 Tax=Actinacidiphila alni TaxID=380248 RepID=A0A1I2JK07_9ACTN|nr:LamG-like jellyroll fold domain-containing protein [Actinacidiphila alni]SFF55182.1 RHS repeat-associated core domain-containing protein [Actinacidiphila alni]